MILWTFSVWESQTRWSDLQCTCTHQGSLRLLNLLRPTQFHCPFCAPWTTKLRMLGFCGRNDESEYRYCKEACLRAERIQSAIDNERRVRVKVRCKRTKLRLSHIKCDGNFPVVLIKLGDTVGFLFSISSFAVPGWIDYARLVRELINRQKNPKNGAFPFRADLFPFLNSAHGTTPQARRDSIVL